MTREFTLIPLDCPTCGAGIVADGEDVIYYCSACRNGYRFDLAAESLVPVDVAFVALAHKETDFYLPFWLLPAVVTIHERTAKGGSFAGLMRFFLGQDDDIAAPHEGTFAVPAFHTSLAATTELTRRYTEALPDLGEKLGERLIGGSYGIDDAKKLAHYALVATEITKPDTLTGLRYTIDFGSERLLGVPFVRDGTRARDAVYGITL